MNTREVIYNAFDGDTIFNDLQTVKNCLSGSEIVEWNEWLIYLVPTKWASNYLLSVGDISYTFDIDTNNKKIYISNVLNQYGANYTENHLRELLYWLSNDDIMNGVVNKINISDESVHYCKDRLTVSSYLTYRLLFGTNQKKKVEVEW